ncbi:hypothetical protein ACFLZX_02610 [Nanoarchaeota archaeon]
MKIGSYLIMLFLLVIIISGCAEEGNVGNDSSVGDRTGSEFPTKEELITLCESFCNEDVEEYCNVQRSFELKGNVVTGSCRAFAKQGRVSGFLRCQGFCKDLPKTNTNCFVDGKNDTKCDGLVG